MRRHKTLIIRRSDHVGDRLGAIFLEPEGWGEEERLRRLRDYFGQRVRVLKADLAHTELTVEVESPGYDAEASHLAAAAADLQRKGAPRNALSMFRQAVEIEPLNAEAITGLGMVLLELEQHAEAVAVLRRARELTDDQVDILQALARCCVQLDKLQDARSYLEQALSRAPNNPGIRRALSALDRKPAAAREPRRQHKLSAVRGKGRPAP